MRPRYLVLIVAAAVLAAAAVIWAASRAHDRSPVVAQPRFKGAVLPAGLAVPSFVLRDQDGARVSSASLRGRASVVMFLPTRCGALCLLTVNQVKGALDDLGRTPAAFAISIDPAHDTPAAARAMLARTGMAGRMRFLLGTRRALAPVWRGFGVDPRHQRRGETARLVLTDPSGIQRVGFPIAEATPERIAHDLRILAAG